VRHDPGNQPSSITDLLIDAAFVVAFVAVYLAALKAF